MLSFKEDFYLKLKAGFAPENEDQFFELWRDIEEQIDNMQFSGMSDAEILKDLGSPEDIYKEYYLDINIHRALNTKEQMIPTGEVDQIAKIKQKLRMLSILDKLAHILFYVVCGIVLLVGIYMAVYFIYELFAEKHVSVGAGSIFLLAAMISYGMIELSKGKSRRKSIGLISVGFLLSVTILLLSRELSWLQYQGEFLSENWDLISQDVDTIEIDGDFPIILTVKDSPDGILHFRVDGNVSRKTATALKRQNTNEIGANYKIELKRASFFRMFTHIPDLHMSLFVPESLSLSELNILLKTGDIIVDNQSNVSNITVALDKGQVICSQINDSNVTIQTRSADIIVQEQKNGFLNLKTNQGKMVVQRSADLEMDLESIQGFIRLQDITSNKVSLLNHEGRTVMNNIAVETLLAESKDGAVIISKQDGNTEVNNQEGDIIITDLSGDIKLYNDEGVIIVTQNLPISGTVHAGTGLVRWQQRDDGKVGFVVNSTSFDTINEFQDSEVTTGGKTIEITNDFGPVKIFRAR